MAFPLEVDRSAKNLNIGMLETGNDQIMFYFVDASDNLEKVAINVFPLASFSRGRRSIDIGFFISVWRTRNMVSNI